MGIPDRASPGALGASRGMARFLPRGRHDHAALDAVPARINTEMVDDAVFVWFVHDVWPNAISARVQGYVRPGGWPESWPGSWYVDVSPVTAGRGRPVTPCAATSRPTGRRRR